MTETPYYLPKGFRYAGVAARIKESGKSDVALFVSDVPAVAAGVYTQNQVVAAPVKLCRSKTPSAATRAVIVNSGNANACTGAQGDADAAQMCSVTADACQFDLEAHNCLVMSTGIIGRQLPMDKVASGIAAAASRLSDSTDAFLNAADAILTTDAGRKVRTAEFQLGDQTIRLAAVAKGAGMIGPNMATMLCLVLTDAALEPADAQELLQATADRSFNNISVEGHTSTNDTMLLLANGLASNGPLTADQRQEFAVQLDRLCIELATMIPTDGEGATHLLEIRVRGAASDADARKISHTVASSNLVKTAIYGSDPNWGRIVSAAGYAGPTIDVNRLSLQINGLPLFTAGEPIKFDASTASQSIRDSFTTVIDLQVGDGPGACTHWTSDLSLDYVRFNSEYTT